MHVIEWIHNSHDSHCLFMLLQLLQSASSALVALHVPSALETLCHPAEHSTTARLVTVALLPMRTTPHALVSAAVRSMTSVLLPCL